MARWAQLHAIGRALVPTRRYAIVALVAACAVAFAPSLLSLPSESARAAATVVPGARLGLGKPVRPALAAGAARVYAQELTADAGKTVYVDGQMGSDDNPGSADLPVKTLARAMGYLEPGDSVVIGEGIYRLDQIKFDPAGEGPDKRTVFKAAPNARVIISSADDRPPTVRMDDYVRIEGLWIGGRWKTGTDRGFFTGGSPIGRGKQIVNCTLFGYDGGISQGSAEYTLYQGNRLVHMGNERFLHPLYISGGSTKGAMAQHTIVDNNIIIAGEGYGIQGWHSARSTIITRNFIARQFWGLVLDGSDHVVANNFFWKETGQPGREGPWGPWLPANNILFVNNVMGPSGGMGPAASSTGAQFHNNAFLGTRPVGDAPIMLMPGNKLAALGASEQEIDDAIAVLDDAFSKPITELSADPRIEPAFQRLRPQVPPDSQLFQAGSAWFDQTQSVNVGPDASAPESEADFWDAFRALGMRDFDRFGNVEVVTP